MTKLTIWIFLFRLSMNIQKITDQNIRKKKLPAQTVIIQLIDKKSNHLAYIACRHEQRFSPYDSDNDRQESHFLEVISNFESEILNRYFEMDKEMEKQFGGWTGELIITDENAQIIHHERPSKS